MTKHRGRGATRKQASSRASKKSSSTTTGGKKTNTGSSKSFQRRPRGGRRDYSSPETIRRPDSKHSLSSKQKAPKNKRRIFSRRKRFGKHRRPWKLRNNDGVLLVVKSLTNSVRLASQSIHNAWKRELGGLIRWYVNLPEWRDRKDDALRNIETMYISNDCNVEATKNSLLETILLETILQTSRHVKKTKTTAAKDYPSGWIEIQMVVDNPFFGTIAIGSDGKCVIDGIKYETIRQGKGVVLETTTRKGEGPAHSAKDWNVVIVPPWAVGQVFYINMVNESPIDLSCEMTIDGHSVANNAPVPARDRRTIRPASHRYFETHEWRLTHSQRIPLQHYAALGNSSPSKNTVLAQEGTVPAQQRQQQQGRCSGHRYNEKRPNYDANDGRVSLKNFPDPSTKGWTFTGSNEDSKVEFFEKKLNNGSLCKMDFYYTTGTIKTVLFHPTQQKTTQLFRKCAVAPEIFLKILDNPRFHSGMGYHRRQHQGHLGFGARRQTEAEDTAMDDESQAENVMTDSNDEGTMETDSHQVTYYAKNEDYDFESAGHTNRQTAMTQLQPTPEFQAWERATRQDWSCIHAKCFVSLRQYMRRRAIGEGSRPRADERMPLPEMTSIVNVQAAQNATLSTTFHSTGASSKPPRQSHVRMERVKGLNDDPDWGTGPVFDLKLYYRAEATMRAEQDTLNINDNDDESSDDSIKDDKMNTSEDLEGLPLAEKLRDEMPLQEYKDEKIDQLHRWYQDCKARDMDKAVVRVREAQRGIETATSAQMVDDRLKVYWDWHQESEWLSL